jgi:hypothetical protein
MKVLLLQLPIQTHDFFFSNENIPLAPAYLQIIASDLGVDAELLPSHLMRYGSDQAILRSILDAKPNIVGMSCYLWNIERSLFLSEQIKGGLPECRVVLGGPEVTPDNAFLLRYQGFDIGVVGEGEEVWRQLLQSFPDLSGISGLLLKDQGRRWQFSGYGGHPPPLNRWSSPYLSGALDTHLQGGLWLETVRGCAYRCAYCCYHKRSPGLRAFPLSRVLGEIRRAWDRELREIVFLDPCFVKRPNIRTFIDGIAAVNRDRRLKFHAESTVEGIDGPLAKRMAKAGFVKIEAGLQSTHRRTLRQIHRGFQPQRFLDGVRSLQDNGIEVMVDIIAGLPGDSLSDIRKSMDWVVEKEAYDYLMLYPLSLMPSTELKQREGELGLVAMPFPPYLLTRNTGLIAQEMVEAFQYYEESMEEDISPLEMPLAIHTRADPASYFKGLSSIIHWNCAETVRIDGAHTAYALTLRMNGDVLRQPGLWRRVLKDYLKKNPFSLLSIEVPSDAFPSELAPLWQIARERQHPSDRDYTVTHSPYRSFFIFSHARGLFWKWPDPREYHPIELHDGQKIDCRPVCLLFSLDRSVPRWFKEHIQRRYSSPPEIRIWQPPEDSPTH